MSEPDLAPTGTTGFDHACIGAALARSTYPHWISIEMKVTDDWRGAIRRAYDLVHRTYRTHDSA